MSGRRLPRWAFPAFLGLLLLAHVVSIFTENVNWDEFALLARASDTLATGRLSTGGRPGLGTLILIPFVRECADAVAAVRGARILWTGFTVALVAGFWTLLYRLLEAAPRRSRDAALGVALLVLVPAFLRFSLQVRTDQPAVALGLWGGVALLASRRSPWWGAAAGALFGLGFLFSQKLAYVFALAAMLAAGDLYLRRELDLRRETARGLLCAAGGLLVWLLYTESVALLFDRPEAHLSGGLATLGYYRGRVGFVFYEFMLSSLIPHLLLIGLLAAAAASDLFGSRRSDSVRRLAVSGAVLGVGTAVLLFHTGAFPYFWMTLGLFPAAAGAIAFGPILSRLERPRDRRFIEVAVWGFLALQGTIAAGRLLHDTQAEQRESLAFVERNFPASAHGFQPERGLFCRHPREPQPAYFAEVITARFTGPGSERRIEEFMREFRSRPVSFLVGAEWRFAQFPEPIPSFWERHYAPYHRSVHVPAPAVRGTAGEAAAVEILVAGRYRLRAGVPESGAALEIDGRPVDEGGVVPLARGIHRVRFLRDIGEGRLVLALDEGPAPSRGPFYRFHGEVTTLLGLR